MIQVIGSFNEYVSTFITRSNNFHLIADSTKEYSDKHAKLVILEPRILISCTHISEDFSKRNNLEKLKKFPPYYKNPAAFGKMIHSIFTNLLSTKSRQELIIQRIIHEAINQHVLEIFNLIDEDEDEIIEKLTEAVAKIIEVNESNLIFSGRTFTSIRTMFIINSN